MNRISFLLLATLALPVAAQELSMSSQKKFTDEQINFFESKIRPQLIEHCYKCHAKEGDKVRGGLLLDTRSASLRGGDTGPAVVPGNLNESLLYEAITYEDSSLEMPPKYKLPAHVIADFKTWIEMGAPDPRTDEADNKPAEKYSSTIDVEAAREEHWAWQVPQKHPVPSTSHPEWARNEIDHFVLAKLEESGLEPNADADPRTFLRRLSFDLIGLPPTPEQTGGFVKTWATDPDKAIHSAVDFMLDSDHYGERWGRHWMDVARYAESTGKEINAAFPHAWRYRDYLVDSFNEDKPFDQFVQEQIAGDLMQFETAEQQAEQIIATGFLAIGTKGLNETNGRQFRFDVVDEQIDTASQAILGTTVACARCHDHKFDPIPMSDYYAMAGIFLSSKTYYGTASSIQNRRSSSLIEVGGDLPSAHDKSLSLAEMIELQFQHDALLKRQQDLQQQIREARSNGEEELAGRLQQQILGTVSQIGAARARLNAVDKDGNYRQLVMGMQDGDTPFDSQILIRGEVENPTDERVPRGFVQVIKTDDEQPIPDSQSGRLQLARWMTSPENPMTARVFANRTWHWLFGQGIVKTVDNFGTTGQEPTHPELLDHLAIRFIELEWSVKDLIKEIVTSRAYRMSSDYAEEKFLKDPENKLVWRANKRRLDAESMRDSILFVSGKLDSSRPNASLIAQVGESFIGRGRGITDIDSYLTQAEFNHRSVYLPIVRDLLPDSLALFDFADPSLVLGARESTIVPSQALFLMNSDFLQSSADAMGRNLFDTVNGDRGKFGYLAFYRCYSRPPTDEESRKTKAYFERFIATAKETGIDEQQARALAGSTFLQSLLSSAEFQYVN
ncbi:MAG: DUF1553 domain-containing protein [Verrucomicrobiales bacterium]|nr:DUF1553 domain-containing protein [Verrucomicrobiales bacterium]